MKIMHLNISGNSSWKRDCELTDVKFFPNLSIEFTRESDQSKWILRFKDYIAFKLTSEEFIVHLTGKEIPTTGAFYIIENSPWVLELSKTNHPAIKTVKHYVFFFYDEIVEVISDELTCEEDKIQK